MAEAKAKMAAVRMLTVLKLSDRLVGCCCVLVIEERVLKLEILGTKEMLWTVGAIVV